jgi:branched-chain amino acid transport system permease protein
MDWVEILENTARASVGRSAIIFAIAAIGLNLHFGYTGLLNFGQIGFMAVGAYGVAISVNTYDLPLGVAFFVGLGAAVVLALLLGLPTLRLRADYLAIVTIAAGEIFRHIVIAPAWRETTGGSDGINGFGNAFHDINPLPDGRYGINPFRYSDQELWILMVGWAMVLILVLFVWLLMRSPWGRVIKSIREDEDAARSLGKNAYGYKMQSLIIGGVIGSMAGIFQAVAANATVPGSFRPETTFLIYTALILGGTARTWGPVVGSIAFWAILAFTDNVLGQAGREGLLPSDLAQDDVRANVRFVLVGVVLMLLVVFRPQGFFGDKREIALEMP